MRLTAFFVAVLVALPAPLSLKDVIRRVGAYVDSYGDRASIVVCTEKYEQHADGSRHMATRRPNEQDRVDCCQREHAGGMAAGEGLFDNPPDKRLEHVLGGTDGYGHRDGG